METTAPPTKYIITKTEHNNWIEQDIQYLNNAMELNYLNTNKIK